MPHRSLPKFLIIPVQLMYFVTLSNTFHKCTCKYESKGKSYKSSDEIAIIIIIIIIIIIPLFKCQAKIAVNKPLNGDTKTNL